MPLISVRTSAAAPAAADALLADLSSGLAALLGKPERYVMTLLETGVPMTFAGDAAPACYVEVKSIGALDGDRTRQVSRAVCELIATHLAIPADRVYIGFEDVPGRLWGWNGSTFG
ncbi:MAG: phenylpyruvate tautomerase MIF-related protein [Cyanobacteriota bacterium]|nr:phenylpyruvate tautomerase MIF-related protein [Cyanobacteriota bacterium]